MMEEMYININVSQAVKYYVESHNRDIMIFPEKHGCRIRAPDLEKAKRKIDEARTYLDEQLQEEEIWNAVLPSTDKVLF